MGRRTASAAALALVAPVIAWAGAPTPAAADLSVCDGQWSVVQSAEHSQQSGEIDSLNSVAALSSTDQWAVGSWLHFPDAYVFDTLVEHWDGSSVGWTIVPSPNSSALNSYFNGIAADAPDDVWAVGGTDQSGPPYRSLVEHWDGTSWSIVSPASFPGVLYGVVARGPNDVWAVGTENYPGRGLIVHWDGSGWTQVSVPAPPAGELLGAAAEPAGAGISATGDTLKPALPSEYVGTLAEHLCPA